MQSTALEIGERLAGQQSSNSCSVGPCFFISKAYAKAYGVKAKEAQLVKGVGVSAKKLEDGSSKQAPAGIYGISFRGVASTFR